MALNAISFLVLLGAESCRRVYLSAKDRVNLCICAISSSAQAN